MRWSYFAVCAVAFVICVPSLGHTQSYPSKTVTIVVPFPAGGVPDSVARASAELLAQKTGQPFIVDHRPGATQMIGMRSVAQARPDGHTLLFGTGTGLTINPNLKKDLPFDTLKDFAPISLIYSAPLFLVARPGLPVNSVKDLIELAKREPGKLNYASGGPGHSSHLAAELLKVLTGINITHVPYQGTAPAIRDVMAGHVDLMFIASGVQYSDKGQVKLLGVTGAKRSSAAPGLPTLAEAGVPGYSATAWFGLLAPAGTPNDIIVSLAGMVKDTIQTGAMLQKVKGNASEMEFAGSSPDEFREFIRSEYVLWQRVIKAANIDAR